MQSLSIIRRAFNGGEALHLLGIEKVAAELNMEAADIVFPLTDDDRLHGAHVYRVPKGQGALMAERIRMLLSPRGVNVAIAA